LAATDAITEVLILHRLAEIPDVASRRKKPGTTRFAMITGRGGASMSNEIAPEGYVFRCQACGKRSRDKYGLDKIDYGYDESCMLNSALEPIQQDLAHE